MAEQSLKRRRAEPKGSQIEKDAEVIQGRPWEVENNIPLERWQFKPRTNKCVCQYCGYHGRLVGHVNQHVNAQHEMTTWYKCKLCQKSFVTRSIISKHLERVHQKTGKQFEILDDEEEIEALRKSMAEKRMKKRKDEPKLLQNEKDAEALQGDSTEVENNIPLERCQFKPRTHKLVCQYCGYHYRRVREVDQHVNTMHEMTSWYKCKLCQMSWLNPSTAYHHLKAVHHAKGKEFEMISDEKEIEDLRKWKAENPFRRRRGGLNLLNIERDAETVHKNSCTQKNTTPIERRQFKPRINKLVCQYCGFHDRKVSNVDQHINTKHEMTSWYKCKLCQMSWLNSSTAYHHLKAVHHTKGKKFEMISDEKEIEDLRKWKAENPFKRMRGGLNLLNIERDAETFRKNSTPIERWQFKPRINKLVCQYCGFHNRKVSNVDQHVNTKHEMTSWYKCKLCQMSWLNSSTAYHHLKAVHHTKGKEFEMISDEKEIEDLRKWKAENPFKRMRGGLNLLNIERDAETVRKYSCIQENTTPIERWQFKPRINKLVCQYCGFHDRKVRNVDQHVNTKHEMTSWYKCKLCQMSWLNSSTAYHHLKAVHHTKGKKFEMISDEKEIEDLRKWKAENPFKRMRGGLNLLNIERDAETFRKNSTPIERWQFKPRINKLVCQYCGFHNRKVKNVDQHVNTKHEMTSWYKCKLCQMSWLNPWTAYNHLKAVHHTKEKKFEMISDEKEIDDLRKLMGEKCMRRRRYEALRKLRAENHMMRREDKLNQLKIKKDAKTVCRNSSVSSDSDFTDTDVTDNKTSKVKSMKEDILEIEEHQMEPYNVGASTQIAKNSTCQISLGDDLSCNSKDDKWTTAIVQGYSEFTDIDVTDNKATNMGDLMEIEKHRPELYNVVASTQIPENPMCQRALEDNVSCNSINDRSMTEVGHGLPVDKSHGTDNDVTDNRAIKMENMCDDMLEIEEHRLELYEVGASTQNLDDLDDEWLMGPT